MEDMKSLAFYFDCHFEKIIWCPWHKYGNDVKTIDVNIINIYNLQSLRTHDHNYLESRNCRPGNLI